MRICAGCGCRFPCVGGRHELSAVNASEPLSKMCWTRRVKLIKFPALRASSWQSRMVSEGHRRGRIFIGFEYPGWPTLKWACVMVNFVCELNWPGGIQIKHCCYVCLWECFQARLTWGGGRGRGRENLRVPTEHEAQCRCRAPGGGSVSWPQAQDPELMTWTEIKSCSCDRPTDWATQAAWGEHLK